MNTYATCPISNKKIDERVARLNGLFTFLLITLFIFTRLWYMPAFLAFDFLLRSTNLSKYSPMGYVSRSIVKLLSMNKKLVNAGPGYNGLICASDFGLWVPPFSVQTVPLFTVRFVPL